MLWLGTLTVPITYNVQYGISMCAFDVYLFIVYHMYGGLAEWFKAIEYISLYKIICYNIY